MKGSDYDTDREWHSRNMKYGEGWAYDSSRSHYKRAKPTGTDPEDDRQADSALPIGSTSETYDPQRDHTMWQRKDSSQHWRHSTSSGDQWKPRLRHDRDISSVAGDTFHCARPSRPNVTGKFAIQKKFRFVSPMGIGKVLDICHLHKKRKPVHIIFPHAKQHK